MQKIKDEVTLQNMLEVTEHNMEVFDTDYVNFSFDYNGKLVSISMTKTNEAEDDE